MATNGGSSKKRVKTAVFEPKSKVSAVQPVRKKRGRPPLQWDEREARQVRLLVGYGLSQKEVAIVLGHALGSVVALYRTEFETVGPHGMAERGTSWDGLLGGAKRQDTSKRAGKRATLQ